MSMQDSTDRNALPLFIVNPASGGGRTRHRIGALIDAIERAGLEEDCLFTTRPGEATELAREAIAAGRTFLVACGGDGTVKEVANGIMDAGANERVLLGTIGLGTGKDIAKCLGIGRPARALRAIAERAERRVDIGRVTAVGEDGGEVVRYFLLECSAGWV
ncbi:acylglycerol kinase family protein, partial [Tepidiforma sp.]|uniref:diacylglycerol/lipid kinase family protein n=1 Tax=Tepidiforma sp. TaxID=2682230 RepID=UPI002ADD7C98